MNIHSATQGSVAPSPTAKLQIPSDTVITPMPLRAPEPPRVGPIPPNDAERMTQAFQNVIDEINQQMKANNRNLIFAVDRRINTTVITVTDKNTGEMVRQLPAEAVLKVAHSIENLKGVLYSDQA